LFTESKKWTEVSHEGKPPAPRDKLTAVAIGTNIFYFGGFGPKSEFGLHICEVLSLFIHHLDCTFVES
jgi:N-acetylneuraminic acid mutarotase